MPVRRAERADLLEIKSLVKGEFASDPMELALQRRYGNDLDISEMIETNILSLVSCNAMGAIEAFLTISISLPSLKADLENQNFQHPGTNWAPWLKTNFNIVNANVDNTVFITYYCGQSDTSDALEQLLESTFELMPTLQNIVYFLPGGLVLFPPFSTPRPVKLEKPGEARLKKSKFQPNFFTAVASEPYSPVEYSLQICKRVNFYPAFEVRMAKIQDCDDLIPLLRTNKLLLPEQGDNFISELLETASADVKYLVGVVDGKVVGFMRIDKNTDQDILRNNYDLDAFDSLCKIPLTSDTHLSNPSAKDLKELNTFHITEFCIVPHYDSLSHEFLKFGFELWPELEYCVLTVPDSASESQLLRSFSRAERKADTNRQLLFIANRFSLIEKVTVDTAREDCINEISKLLSQLDNADAILQSVKSQFLDNGSAVSKSFQIMIKKQIVGVAVVEFANSMKSCAIRDQFEIESFQQTKWNDTKGVAILKYFIINPLFETQSRTVLLEIMRQLEITGMAYVDDAESNSPTKNVAAKEFVPVIPRRTTQYPNNMRDGETLLENIEGNLQLLTIPLLLQPRLIINNPIVVVGASDTGLSFLETLIYTRHVHFTNLILVSTNPITPPDSLPFVSSNLYPSSRLKQLGLDGYVKFTNDTAVGINRSHKTISLKSGGEIRYDYLILTPGRQYQPKISSSLRKVPGVHGFNQTEFAKLSAHLKHIHTSKPGKIVVYGRSLQAYMAVDFCISLGLSPDRIYFVNPFVGNDAFAGPEISKLVELQLNILNVNYYEGFNQDGKLLLINEIECLLYADELNVDERTVKAVKDCNLVYDNGIIIDNVCRTKDPFIFAAGSATNYTAALRTNWSQALCNQKEIGNRLASLLLNLFDPSANIDKSLLDTPVDNYKDCITKLAKLPGGLKYLHYDIPKISSFSNSNQGGRDLVIHNDSEYTRIRIDTAGYISSFTYLGTRDIPISNLSCLYGKHEKYFNRLVSRFDEGIIKDFIKYFEEDWALCIFHDRFLDFTTKLLNEAEFTKDEELKKLIDALAAETDKLTLEQEDAYYQKFDSLGVRQKWDKMVFDYLENTKLYKSYP